MGDNLLALEMKVMGNIIRAYQLLQYDFEGVQKPLVYCNCDIEFLNNAISLESDMTDALLSVPKKFRNTRVPQCFDKVLSLFPANIVLKHIDVLFNPDYKIDVIAMLVLACKRHNFSIVWPGKYIDGRLIYGEEDYRDYQIYNIKDYDITCVL